MVSTLDLRNFKIFPDSPRITNDKEIGLWGEEIKGMKAETEGEAEEEG